MIVNEQKPIIFKNKCNCIVEENLLEKAILWYSDKPVTSIKTIYMFGKYPAVSIYKEKIHVHRLIKMYLEKRKLDTTEFVHHKDENKLNSLSDNLEIIEPSIHQSLHNKGKTLSEDHKDKIRKANKKRLGMKMKKRVNIPLVELKKLLNEGKSIRSIADKYDCDWSTVKSRIIENPSLLEVSQ